MVVISIENYEPAVRGMLTRFMTELRASVFVGDIPANTREQIWKYLEAQADIDAIMIYNSNTEQGFSFKSTGNPSRKFKDWDGIQLLTRVSTSGDAYRYLWAKPAELKRNIPEKKLLSHMLEVGWTADYFMNHSSLKTYMPQLSEMMHISESEVIQTVSFICAMHDIGKCHPWFQMKNEHAEYYDFFFNSSIDNHISPGSSGFRHELYGAAYIKEHFGKNGFGAGAVKAIADIVSMHHVKIGLTGDNIKLDGLWTVAQDNLSRVMTDEFKPVNFELSKEDTDAFCSLVLGILMIADWTASDEILEELNVYMFDDRYHYKEEVCRRLEKYVTENQLNFERHSILDTMKKVFPFMKEWILNPLQKIVEEYIRAEGADFDCMLIEAEMGTGKTESAMYAALKSCEETRKGGIYFALPTGATSEAMQPRMDELLHESGIDAHAALYTGTAWLKCIRQDDADRAQWALPSSMKFMRPYACGTVDQLMTCVKKVKHGMINFTGIADKVIVIDEFHAYDAYMLNTIEVLLSWLKAFHTPVILLSATLPKRTKQKIFEIYNCSEEISEAYPLLSVCKNGYLEQHSVQNSGTGKKYKIRFLDIKDDPAAIAMEAEKQVQAGGCIDIIMNTVNSAVEVFKEVQKTGIPCYLFHSRFPIDDKEKITDKLITLFGKDRSKRPEKAIVVATQVLEQSIDLDFDFTMTALCPIDLLLQRMGREWRHSNVGTIRENWTDVYPETLILRGKDDKIYPKELLERTNTYLEDKPFLALPEDIRPAVDTIYKDVADTEDAEAWLNQEVRLSIFSKTGTLKAPGTKFQLLKNRDILSEENNSTRYSESGESTDIAIIPHELYERIRHKQYSFEDVVRIRNHMTVSILNRIIDKECGYDKHYCSDRFLNGMILLDEDEQLAKLDPVLGFQWNI